MILTPTSGGSIKTPSGNTYTLRSDTSVYRNGTRMQDTSGTSLLTYQPNLIYRQAASTHIWRSWDGSRWRVVSAPPVTPGQPRIALTAPQASTMAVVITEVPDADGYYVQWRRAGTATWRTAA